MSRQPVDRLSEIQVYSIAATPTCWVQTRLSPLLAVHSTVLFTLSNKRFTYTHTFIRQQPLLSARKCLALCPYPEFSISEMLIREGSWKNARPLKPTPSKLTTLEYGARYYLSEHFSFICSTNVSTRQSSVNRVLCCYGDKTLILGTVSKLRGQLYLSNNPSFIICINTGPSVLETDFITNGTGYKWIILALSVTTAAWGYLEVTSDKRN